MTVQLVIDSLGAPRQVREARDRPGSTGTDFASVYALVRIQHVVSLYVFTGGLEEPIFDIHLGKLTNPPGSPAADAYHPSHHPDVNQTLQMGHLSAL